MIRVSPICLVLMVQCCFGQPSSSQALTDSERANRMSSWRGEKVILLPQQRYGVESLNSDHTYNFWLPSEDPSKGLAKFSQFVGRTGIVDSVITEGKPHLVISLDAPSQTINAGIYNSGVVNTGFFTELEAARQWIGRILYSQGILELPQISSDPALRLTKDTVKLLPTTRLRVVRADFGTAKAPVVLHLETPTGNVVAFPESNWDVCFDPRFHLNHDSMMSVPFCQSGPWKPERHFLVEDPMKTFPKWTPDTWKLVRSGQVAIGMTKDMLGVTCGTSLIMTGTALTDGQAFDIFRCNGREFLVRDGRVAKYTN